MRAFPHLVVTLILTLSLFAGVYTTHTQEDNEPPTILPSKTPTPVMTPASSRNTPAPTLEAIPFEITEPFIQADLSILSGNVQRPNGLFWHNGMVYAICNGDWTIYEINADTGATLTYIWGIRNAHALYVENSGEELGIWVPDFQTNQLIHIYRRNREVVAEGLSGPWGISPYQSAGFLITNLLNNDLVYISREGDQTVIANGFRSPAGVISDQEYVYVANNGSARRAIEWFELSDINDVDNVIDSSEEDQVNSLVSGLQSTTGLAMGPDNYLYFAYSLGTRGVVGRVNPEECRDKGGCTHDEVEIVIYTDLAAPLSGLTVAPDMRLYIHTIFSPDIYYVDLDDTPVSTVRRDD